MTNAVVNGISKVIYASLKSTQDSNRVLVLPTPTNVVWNRGLAEQVISQTTDFGELYTSDAIATGRTPALTLSYGALTKELLALKTGFRLANQADTGIFVKSLQVKSTTIAAATTGQECYSMVADQSTSVAYVLRAGISTALTRQPYSTFAAGTADSFAQGANGAYKFSDNLVASREWVTLYATYPVTGADVLSQNPFDEFVCSMVGILNDKTVFNLVFDPVTTNKSENNEINFGAESYDFPMRITDPACVPTLKFLGRTRVC